MTSLLPLTVVAASHYFHTGRKHPNPTPISPHTERIELVTGGRGWVLHQEQWKEVTTGHLLWHAEGDYTISRSDFDNPYRCLTVTFKVQLKRTPPAPRISFWADIDAVHRFTHEALCLYLDENTDREAFTAYVYGSLLLQAKQDSGPAQGARIPSLRRALNTMQRDYARPLSVEQLAQQSGYSSPHFHEIFHSHLGTTPHEFLIQLRIQKAKEQLVLTNDPVKTIAIECGFSHAAAFSHSFKQRTGMTPGSFRRSHRLDQLKL